MKIFNLDSPLMQFLSKMADLMWVNILCVICCIPIFTIGASVTALHYVCLKIVRDEEIYITKSFFKSFKENFKQSTLIWLIFLVIGIILGYDIYFIIYSGALVIEGTMGLVVKIGIIVATTIYLFTYMFVFPLQAKFDNPIKVTIKNALLVSIMQCPKTICMILMLALPFVVIYFSESLVPVVFLFFASIQAFLAALMYNKTFLKLEGKFYDENPEAQQDLSAEDEHIFSDEPLVPADPTEDNK